MAMALITPAAVTPLTLSQVKEFIRVEHNDDDQVISNLLDQAITHLEALSGQKLINQTWRFYYDELPDNNILQISAAPVNSLVELRYYDGDGNPVIVDPSDYETDFHSRPARILLNTPICPGQAFNGIELDIQLGFGDAGIDVPGNLLRALMLIVTHWYEFRGAVEPGDQPVSNPAGLTSLIAPWADPKI